MSIWKKKSNILVTCPKGVSSYLQDEITALEYPVKRHWETAVQTEGTLGDTMTLNLHLRTAQRVLYRIDTFIADTPEALYRRLYAFPWENILHDSGPAAYFCVTSVTDHPLITDSRFVNVKVKDAIVDRIRDQRGGRPDSGANKNKAVIHVYWKSNRADIFLDTSGERLSLRGYRKIPLYAPMQESLAASVIRAAGWTGANHFINPMCGSGTLAIEAAFIALNRAPGLLRNNFGFLHIRDFPDEDWQALLHKANDTALSECPVRIIATDIDRVAVDAARQNAKTGGVDRFIDFRAVPFEKTHLPEGGGVIILNPPYGARMKAEKANSAGRQDRKNERKRSYGQEIILRKSREKPAKDNKSSDRQQHRLEETYRRIGDFLKKADPAYKGYLFTGNLDMIKKVGLRTTRRMILYNGDIECRLLEYELYPGSRKRFTENGSPE